MKLDESKPGWILEIGTYPGILFGVRTYVEISTTTYVLYIPFVDIALIVFK
jgi:hypothetical protein|tara:strand:+ start:434 stop:586 length:153 start_codon:yes stop_codon:yes gene_type:complete